MKSPCRKRERHRQRLFSEGLERVANLLEVKVRMNKIELFQQALEFTKKQFMAESLDECELKGCEDFYVEGFRSALEYVYEEANKADKYLKIPSEAIEDLETICTIEED